MRRKEYTETEVLGLLEAEIRGAGGLDALGEKWGCSGVHLCRVRRGKKPFGPKVLAALGLRAVRRYTRLKEG